MTEPAPTDEKLMLLAQRGDKDAFEAIVRRHQNEFVNFFRRSGVSSVADDLAQETFVRLYNYRTRYTPKAKLRTFLYLIARQVRIDFIRKTIRRENTEIGALAARETGPRGEVSDGGHAERNIASRLDIEAALERLPDEMREAIVLGFVQGLKYAEVAEVLGVPEGTVKSRVFNALRKLREYLS